MAGVSSKTRSNFERGSHLSALASTHQPNNCIGCARLEKLVSFMLYSLHDGANHRRNLKVFDGKRTGIQVFGVEINAGCEPYLPVVKGTGFREYPLCRFYC